MTRATTRGNLPPNRSKDLDALTNRLNILAIADLWQHDASSLDRQSMIREEGFPAVNPERERLGSRLSRMRKR
jgi:hypothetical protein